MSRPHPAILCTGSLRDEHCIRLADAARATFIDLVLLDPFHTRLRLAAGSGLELMGSAGVRRLETPHAVLLRTRYVPRLHDISVEAVQAYHRTSAAVGFCALLANHFADRLVNRREAAARVADKLACARLVDSCGLDVPETLVTSDPATVRELAREERWVVKFLGHPFQPRLEDNRFVWRTILTQRLDPAAADRLGDAPMTPVLLQREIERRRDWRVFATREAVFAASLKNPGSRLRVDSRLDFKRLAPVEEKMVPREIRDGAQRLLEAAELHFAVFDVLEAPDGRFWWVDINPNGQWAELDALFDGALAKHFVASLLRRAHV